MANEAALEALKDLNRGQMSLADNEACDQFKGWRAARATRVIRFRCGLCASLGEIVLVAWDTKPAATMKSFWSLRAQQLVTVPASAIEEI